MPSFTKKAIVESFLRLVGKKPVDKITVRDVVDDCGINRNTFYYYFQDIYAVLEELCQALTEQLPTEAPLAETLVAFYDLLCRFYLDHPRTSRSLLVSMGQDGLDRYFAAELDRVILSCLRRETANAALDPEYLQHCTVFLRHALFGYCLNILRADKSEPLERAGRDLFRMLTGLAQKLLGEDSGKT